MKTLFLRVLIIASASLFPFVAPNADDRFCRTGVYVIFGNGVWNDKEAADASTRLLTRRLERVVSGTALDGIITYATAHNPSEGKLLDLLETFEQNAQTDTSRFWRYLAGLDAMPDFLQNKLIEIANEVDAAIVQSNPAVQRHIEKYNAFLGEGNKVVLVAHSQGNLFANIAHLGIDDDKLEGFGIVSVGNPDSYVAGGGRYTTLEEDIIITNVRGSLPANLDNFFGINLADVTGHEFVKSYMAPGRRAESAILDNIMSSIAELNYPRTSLNAGVITATLTWGDNPDLDLHVFEPNGTHVYYRNLAGLSGYLDRDDVTGFGPEHYYVSCDTIETGTYEIGVNYFYGFSAEVGTVTLKAGEQVRTREETFTQWFGGLGNADPRIMFKLRVTGTPEEGYEFLIE